MTETQSQRDGTGRTFVISDGTKTETESTQRQNPQYFSFIVYIFIVLSSKLLPVSEAEKLHFGWRGFGYGVISVDIFKVMYCIRQLIAESHLRLVAGPIMDLIREI